jgi:hypothetical protein
MAGCVQYLHRKSRFNASVGGENFGKLVLEVAKDCASGEWTVAQVATLFVAACAYSTGASGRFCTQKSGF